MPMAMAISHGYAIFMNRPFAQNRGLYNRSQVMQRVIRMRNRI